MERKRVWKTTSIATVAALIALTIAPQSGWIVRQQLLWTAAMLLPMRVVTARAPDLGDTDKAREAVAARHPDDLGMQIAHAEMAPDKLMALHGRFARRPELDAALLVALSKDRLKLDDRAVDQAQLQWPNPSTAQNQKSKAPTPETLATWDATAQMGEAVDPTNAFFPMMRAIGLFAARRDDEACAAWERASVLPRYDEYQGVTVRGEWRVADAAHGMESGTIPKTAIRAGELFPHFALLRGAARLAVVHAIDREKAGKTEEGFAIRRAVARCGDRMRTDSPWVIGNLVGEAISNVARHRPGGAPEFPTKKEDSAVRAAKIKQSYEAYLRQIGHSDEIAWVENEDAATASIKSITTKGLANGPGAIQGLVALIALWAISAFVLTNALLVTLLGGIAAVLSRTTTIRAAKPLGPLVLLGVFGLFALVIVYLSQATFGLAGLSNGGLTKSGADDTDVTRILSVFMLCALPLTMTIVFAVKSRKEKIPASAGIVRGFVHDALRTATGFLLVFVALVGVLSVWEAHELRILGALTSSEGKTYAADQHKAWPSFAPTIPQP